MKGRGVPSGYVEGLNDARTLLEDFFSILLETATPRLLTDIRGIQVISTAVANSSKGSSSLLLLAGPSSTPGPHDPLNAIVAPTKVEVFVILG